MVFILLWAFILAVIDQISKLAALKYLKPVGSVSFIDGIMNFTFVENRGAAFGVLTGARWFFIVITIAVTIAAVIYIKKYMPNKKEYGIVKLSIILILGGAWGNAFDRFFRGYVVDMFDFNIFGYDFPVFNFADICVCIGAFLLVVGIMFFDREDKK